MTSVRRWAGKGALGLACASGIAFLVLIYFSYRLLTVPIRGRGKSAAMRAALIQTIEAGMALVAALRKDAAA